MSSDKKNDDESPTVQMVSDPEEKRILLRQFYLETREKWRAEGKLTPERERFIENKLSFEETAEQSTKGTLADLLREMSEKDKNIHLSDDEVEAITLEIMADEDDG